MNLKIQELSITLFVKNLQPGTIHPAVLQYLGIIPSQWELIKNPVHSDREVKLVFTNQVRLIVQPNRIIFAETIGHKKLDDIQITQIALRYLKTFSNIDYQGISINPGGYVRFNSHEAASLYMSQNLLPSKPWQTFTDSSINAMGLKLAYPYKKGKFYLDINQASVEIVNQVIPAVWFVGNFNYLLDGKDKTEKLEQSKQLIKQWRIDVDLFANFISEKFLASIKTPVFGVLPAP